MIHAETRHPSVKIKNSFLTDVGLMMGSGRSKRGVKTTMMSFLYLRRLLRTPATMLEV